MVQGLPGGPVAGTYALLMGTVVETNNLYMLHGKANKKNAVQWRYSTFTVSCSYQL